MRIAGTTDSQAHASLCRTVPHNTHFFSCSDAAYCVFVSVADGIVTTGNAGDCRSVIGRRVSTAAPPSAAAVGSSGIPPDPDSPAAAAAAASASAAGGPGLGGTYRAIALSEDHQIDTNEAERKRLLTEHPNEPDIIHHNRVKGRLQPTRGLGGTHFSPASASRFLSSLMTHPTPCIALTWL
jgi:hypothetical protein